MDSRTQVATVSEGRIAILLVVPLDSGRFALRNILTPPQWEIWEASTYRDAVGILDNRRIAVAISDTKFEDGHWQKLLAHLQNRANPPNLVVSSRLADERLWAEVLNLGGYDVLVQPFDRGEVRRIVRMAWTAWRQRCPGRTPETYRKLRAQAAS